MTQITYGSVCSGIEAASVAWEPLGWKPLWFSEIEPFPSSVLAHHWPQVPNLGDFTGIRHKLADGTVEPPDVLVGGTPCQSWSVAGLRKGSEDPRGQLTFEFVRLVEEMNPKAVVWENVPGILSAEGGRPFAQFLDSLGSLGYIVNCDILDAQFFGVAQRRRRVFVVCQRADILMSQRTATSWTTLAVLTASILRDTLDALLMASEKGQEPWEFLPESVCVGLRRKMQCFYRHGEGPLRMWPRNLEGAHPSAVTVPTSLGSRLGGGPATAGGSVPIVDTSSLGSSVPEEDAQLFAFLSTLQSWSKPLEGLLSTLNPSTISTVSRTTIESKIYSYVEILLTIAQSIQHLNPYSPGSLKLVSSISTALQSATRLAEHARFANISLFCDSWIPGPWDDFIRKARHASEALADLGKRCPESVLSERDSLPGYTEEGNESRQGAAADVAPCIGASGRGVSRTGETQGQDPVVAVQGFQGDIARTLQARHDSSPCADRGMDVVAIQDTTVGRADGSGPQGKGYDESGVQFTLTKTDIHAIAFEPGVAGRLGGHCYSEVSGTLRKDAGDNQMAVAFSSKDSGGGASLDLSPTMQSMGHSESHANGIGCGAVAFQATDYASGAFEPVDQSSPITTSVDRTRAAPIQVSGIPTLAACVTSGEGNRFDGESTTMIPGPMQVRRLTPDECAVLQGFPKGHARIPWNRGYWAKGSCSEEARAALQESCPDGPQYKAYGNSMAVPVMHWIGKRLAQHLKALP